jgi:hypothetical protein
MQKLGVLRREQQKAMIKTFQAAGPLQAPPPSFWGAKSKKHNSLFKRKKLARTFRIRWMFIPSFTHIWQNIETKKK